MSLGGDFDLDDTMADILGSDSEEVVSSLAKEKKKAKERENTKHKLAETVAKASSISTTRSSRLSTSSTLTSRSKKLKEEDDDEIDENEEQALGSSSGKFLPFEKRPIPTAKSPIRTTREERDR